MKSLAGAIVTPRTRATRQSRGSSAMQRPAGRAVGSPPFAPPQAPLSRCAYHLSSSCALRIVPALHHGGVIRRWLWCAHLSPFPPAARQLARPSSHAQHARRVILREASKLCVARRCNQTVFPGNKVEYSSCTMAAAPRVAPPDPRPHRSARKHTALVGIGGTARARCGCSGPRAPLRVAPRLQAGSLGRG